MGRNKFRGKGTAAYEREKLMDRLDREERLRLAPPRLCGICGKEIPRDAQGSIKYCSPVCARQARTNQNRERLHKMSDAERAKKAVRTPKYCLVCDTEIPASNPRNFRYCCREHAAQARTAAHKSSKTLAEQRQRELDAAGEARKAIQEREARALIEWAEKSGYRTDRPIGHLKLLARRDPITKRLEIR